MRFLPLAFALSFLIACSKPAAPRSGFDLDLSPDQVFAKVLATLNSQGFEIDSYDRDQRTITTKPRDISGDEFRGYAKIENAPERYQWGRYTFRVVANDMNGRTNLEITAMLEGAFQPKQTGSAQFGTIDDWVKQPSNGSAERNLFASISAN